MQQPKRNPALIWRHEKRREEEILAAMAKGEDVSERGTVILLEGGTMHQLNLVGGMIWSLCDGNRSREQIVEALATEFDAERNELEADVAIFLEDLQGRGWLIDG
ncbi:hypothetical protein JCM30471_09210 [Desulfuromonas carbonis]|uniref:pyrroloquinoline quinone biosynthesis peptide chaperone PqqD n=1 Tax=Desulfuromonas sp. DDH964 TaxID=1823759 RepID=UPI00078D961F|nr:pyrroloquinoline quinone biosynthesis peptide chaperone PqqD [Desulfuromonas sp. DDH964]AMV72404.1 GeoRSP system PqqD family protein [Desulfuromonas sp. DDH964]